MAETWYSLFFYIFGNRGVGRRRGLSETAYSCLVNSRFKDYDVGGVVVIYNISHSVLWTFVIARPHSDGVTLISVFWCGI